MLDSMIRCRIEKETLEAVTPVLDRMGLTVSGAIRIFLKRIEQTGEFPLDLGQQVRAQSQVAGIAAALEYLRYQEQIQAKQGFEMNLKKSADARPISQAKSKTISESRSKTKTRPDSQPEPKSSVKSIR